MSVYPLPDEIDGSDMTALREAMKHMAPENFVFPLVGHALGTLVGAFVTAFLAKTRQMRLAMAIGIAFLIGGILMIVNCGAYLITSVRSKCKLSENQVVEFYRSRWGVEVFYRSFKQTFGRRKLKSHAAVPAIVELQWSLAGLWAIGLYTSYEQASKTQPLPQLSMARAIQAFRATARDYLHPQRRHQRLSELLRKAVLDEYPPR